MSKHTNGRAAATGAQNTTTASKRKARAARFKALAAEIEIAAAARIVGLSADEFITDALQSAINAAKDLNGGELDLTADERAKLDAAKEN